MNVDLRGRVKNTKLVPSNCLLPLFEAVVNSIHAIEEAGGGGQIDITLKREESQGALRAPESLVASPVTGFTVEDTGCGFDEHNYKAFLTSDSTNKAAKGGKGIGRLLWLKAFDRAAVESTYTEGGKQWRRRFSFKLSETGVDGLSLEEVKDQENKTTVRLHGFRKPFSDKCPRAAEGIARRLIEHCLEYFVLSTCPAIRLHDPANSDVIDVNELFSSQIRKGATAGQFSVKDREFRITHLMIAPGQDVHHRLHFCAHNRAVIEESLVAKVPNLQGTLRETDADRPFVYAGYVSGAYLDETVSPERTSFDVPTDGMLDLPGEVSWQQLMESAVGQATGFLAPYTDPIRVAKHERIRKFVQDRAPQYRPLLKHKTAAVELIPPNVSDERLDIELYKIEQSYDAELRQRYHTILASNGNGTAGSNGAGAQEKGAKEHADFERELERFLEEWNEAGVSKLARHVLHRKATLAFLESRLQLKDDGRYPLENAVHQIVFPLKRSSDDVRAEQMNLWILDEKLAYHYYLASDMRFDQMAEAVEIESAKRPDIAIFNAASAFVDAGPPFASIVLIEFKRPARDDYTDDDNPISQLYEYVRDIKAGETKDRHGRPISVASHTPFYGYIVCDITRRLQTQAENAQLTRTPDSNGFFGYNPNLGIYVEIISFDKLIDNAKKRNAVLFDKLGVLDI